MEKIDGTSMDLKKINIERLKELFPNTVTEGKIDFDVLREILGDEIDVSKEKYQFTWNGKKDAIKITQLPSTKTLRPCREKSKDWDTTENLYIEGDNFEVLKLLQKTYFNKVDVIYIDPPYNTGTNLIYKNDFSISSNQYLIESGQADELGKRFVSNPSTSGRFHSDWLTMIYERLLLARNLLNESGIIAIAMDESEIGTLNVICKEIFGEDNVLGTIVTRCNPQGRGAKNVDPVHEYHIICCKDLSSLEDLKLKRSDSEANYRSLMRTGTNSRKYERPYRFYPLLVKNGKVSCVEEDDYNKIYLEKKAFDDEHIKSITDKYEKMGYEVVFPIARNGEEKVWQRQYSRVREECSSYIYENGSIKAPVIEGKTPFSLWSEDKYNNVEYGTNLVKKLFDGVKVFDYCKSIYTVKDLIAMKGESQIVLDFFSGSGTTAHSVMKLNIEEDTNRHFILVQLPEKCSDDSDAKKMGYDTICEIGEERIRRSGKQLQDEWNKRSNGEGLLRNDSIKFPFDVGFKVFRVDSTCINPWDNEKEYDEDSLLSTATVFKIDRTKEDVLYEIMLKYGIFDQPVSEIGVNGKKMFRVGKRHMIVCLEDNVDENDVKAIGELSPRVVVFKEDGFADDNAKINAEYNLKKTGIEDVKCI